jgi:ornithine cyclodeaminase/alanine dehydrogenase
LGTQRRPIRYLSRGDVERLGLTGAALADTIERTLGAAAEGAVASLPKTGKALADGRLHQSMMAVGLGPPAPALAATKVVGLAPGNAARGLPHIGGLIVLSDADTGLPVAVMDAAWITEARTAATTLVAARRLARRSAASIGFVACGAQARAHLRVLREELPLARVAAYSRRPETSEGFAADARALGLAAQAVADPRAAVAGQDVVVTSVPASPGLEPFLEAAWLEAGAFAALVDLGRSWRADGFAAVERVVVDDRAQAEAGKRRLTPSGPYAGDLGELVAGTAAGRRCERERAVFVCQGMALADLAAAALALDRAAAAGVGALLPA